MTGGFVDVRPETQTYGTKTLATGFEEIAITETIIGVGLRFDPNAVNNDLKAIQLKTETATYTSKAYDFDFGDTGWYDLPGNLVGFTTYQAMSTDDRYRVFTSIKPIFDKDPCIDITIDRGTTLDLELTYDAVLSGVQQLNVDLLNEYVLSNPNGKICNDVEIKEFSKSDFVPTSASTFRLEVSPATPPGINHKTRESASFKYYLLFVMRGINQLVTGGQENKVRMWLGIDDL